MTNSALFLAVFLACAVEAVEALTIILAAGTARDWRSANTGLLAGLATLAAVVAAVGPALSAIPLDGLRVFVIVHVFTSPYAIVPSLQSAEYWAE